MVIEFFGAPGAGKTYFANKLAKSLNEDSLKCINLTDKSRTSFLYKIKFKLMRIFIGAVPYYKKKCRLLKGALSEYRLVKARFNDCPIDEFIKEISFLDYLYNHYSKRKNIYIFDEGISQQIANMIVNYGVSFELAKSVLDCTNKACYSFLLKSELNQLLSSIEERNRHVCFIDELKDDNLVEFLNCYLNACDNISHINGARVIQRMDFDEQLNELKRDFYQR